MNLIVKTLVWSLSIWTIWFLLVCSLYFTPMTNSVVDQIRAGVIAALLFPGGVLVVLTVPPGISITGLTNHNIDIGLIIFVNCLVYFGLLYLVFWIKKNHSP